ncbi:MAG: hypothetical protein AAF614_20620 [Chloroflexota bacterium]
MSKRRGFQYLEFKIGTFVALFLLLFPGLQPLLRRQLTCGFDNNFHLWRSVQIGALLEEGILFSRWAPHMAQGFGYPLYLFQSSFSAYLTAVFHLIGFSWPVALNIVYAIGFIGSAYAMWLLARDLWGERGAMVAAVAYAYAPFHAYVLFYRASLSETVAWLFPPLILWGLRRWQQQGERKGLLTAVFSFLLLIWTHDVTAYALFPLFVGWVAVQKRPWHGLLAFLLGFGSGAFFWLPALAERSAIQFDRANSAWPFLYYNNFLPLSNFLALPRNADPTLLNDWPPRALGFILLILALAGSYLALRHLKKEHWLILLLLAALAGYTFLIFPISRPLWDNISLLTAFQFPWRFLAPATLIASLLAGSLFPSELVQKNSDAPRIGTTTNKEPLNNLWRFLSVEKLGFVATLLLLPLLHIGWFYPQHCNAPKNLTIEGMIEWETATLTTGTTAKDELRPMTVQRKPAAPERPVWEERFPAAQLPDGATISSLDVGALGATIELETAVSFTATYQAFAFPGWAVEINGRSVPITPSNPEGLITFPIPAGQSTINIAFGETPLRLTANVITVLSLLGVLLWVYVAEVSLPRSSQAPKSEVSAFQAAIPRLREAYSSLFVLGLVLIALKLAIVDQEITPLRTSLLTAENSVTGIDVPRQLLFGSGNRAEAKLALLGYDEVPPTVFVNEHLEMVLYWQPLNVAGSDYRVGITLVDENGLRWSEAGLRDARWYRNPPPTRNWDADSYALTAYWLDQLPGTPPGRYTLELSVFDRETLAPLTIFDESGQAIGPTMPVGEIELTPPQNQWTPEAVAMQYSLENCDTVSTGCLWGSNVDRAEAAPGDSVLVTLFWTGLEAATLQLIDANGSVATSWPLTFPRLDTGLWRQQTLIRLPVDLTDGIYQWRLVETGSMWGNLAITAPERLLTLPAIAQPVDTTFGDIITLYGVEAAPNEDGSLSVSLVWRGEQIINDSYHVFLHLIDAEGNLVAQSDGIPAGNRPTTGWLPGEYITDVRYLAASPDNYTLRVGLYKPGAERLLTREGTDFVELNE